MDFENTSVETQEVAEPAVEETGAEELEVAEPVSEEVSNEEPHKNSADESFANMRRQMQEAKREADEAKAELAALQAQNEARDNVFARLTGRDEDADISALAEITGMSEDEIKAEMDAGKESAEKDLRIQQLETAIADSQAERLMQEDLAKLRRIDPSLKSLEDLGDAYVEYVNSGLSPERAYWAIKAEERANQATPPKPAGTVATGTAEKDYFTNAEIDAMSSEQLTKNYKKILASWERNG